MATYQVRYDDANGQKILSDPLRGIGAEVATSEVPGVVQPDGVTTKVDPAGVLSVIGGNLLMNDEIWITESGEWESPITGWAQILLIGGGDGGLAGNYLAQGGPSGSIHEALVYLSAGDKVTVNIGAGGLGCTGTTGGFSCDASRAGGMTSFGSLTSSDGINLLEVAGLNVPDGYKPCFLGVHIADYSSFADKSLSGAGGGFGVGWVSIGSDAGFSGFFGAGGAGLTRQANRYASDGQQGAIRLRFWNPAKANGSTK
ncbi:MAG: hypothetical protein HDQ88_09015 [Clostridia bacterium]|nr:hypothetical protein [Clostridia bacterium]